MNDADGIIALERLQTRKQLLGGLSIDDVLPFGTREYEATDDAAALDPNAAHADAPGKS
jgi:hypothetical protein